MIELAFGISFLLYAVVGMAGVGYGRCQGKDIPSNLLIRC